MSPLDPALAEQLAGLKGKARRLRAQGRRWYLRAMLMAVISGFALYHGGQVNNLIGVVMIVLAALSLSLGRSQRRDAAQMAVKISIMERS